MMWSEQALSLIRSHAGIIKRSSTAGKRRGNQKSPEQSRCLRHRAQINVMTRLLEATKCNQNPLQGSVRRLSNQSGSPMPPPAPHPHPHPLSKPDLRLPARSAEKPLNLRPAPPAGSSGLPSVSSCVSPTSECAHLFGLSFLFALVCVCVHWQILVPAGLHLLSHPMLRGALGEDKYLKKQRNPVSLDALA